MFDNEIEEVRHFLNEKKKESKITEIKYKSKVKWPYGGGKNIIFKEDVGVELGSPQMRSVSFQLWTEDKKRVRDGKISILGPDLYKSKIKDLPFGKILLLGVNGFNEENTYDRYRELEAIRFDIDLKGYMMKGESQYQREWSRISIEAIKNKFSFNHLGCELINRFKEKEYVEAVEVIFVTSSTNDVIALQNISQRVGRIINAMDKMVKEMSFDCDSCEFIDVCDEVVELRDIKKSLESNKDNNG